MNDLRLVPGDLVPAGTLHSAFLAAFADYVAGPFTVPLAQWPLFLGRQGVELRDSRVAVRDETVLAFSFVAPRTALNRWRLATMGALPQARGTGAAAVLLDDFLARARDAGVGAELECFAQNERALRLYRSRGFEVRDSLYGYQRAADAPVPQGFDEEFPVSVDSAFPWLDARAANLPLQVTPPSLKALPVCLQAWRLGEAQVIFSQGAEQRLTLHSLVARDNEAQRLVAALLRSYAGWSVAVPQLQGLDWGGAALEALGFERLPLHQFWMHR